MSKVWLIIIGMFVVTYIPRLLPFLMLDNMRLSKRARKMLKVMPHAALGALVFPGAINAIEGETVICLVGIVTAIFLASLSKNTIITIIGSVGVITVGLMV